MINHRLNATCNLISAVTMLLSHRAAISLTAALLSVMRYMSFDSEVLSAISTLVSVGLIIYHVSMHCCIVWSYFVVGALVSMGALLGGWMSGCIGGWVSG